MICPTCYGRRLFYYQGHLVPCPDCEGHGTLHCCDGLQAQPDEGIVKSDPLPRTAPAKRSTTGTSVEPRFVVPRGSSNCG